MSLAAHNFEPPVPTTSSVPEPLPADQEQLFRAVLQALEDAKIPYAVSGAFALRQHTGICRYTKDLDVFLTPADATRALALLSQSGFKCEVTDPVWLAKAHRDGFFVDLITGMSNGVIQVSELWIERAAAAEVFGVQTRVLAPEELIASKLFVIRRERFDGGDIAHVIYGTRGKLEWDRLLELAGEHWELLLWNLLLFRYSYPAQSGYVPQRVWHDLLGRFTQAIGQPDSGARFRGSLVDDKVFAIDVKEWGLDNLLAEHQQRTEKIVAPCDERRLTGDGS